MSIDLPTKRQFNKAMTKILMHKLQNKDLEAHCDKILSWCGWKRILSDGPISCPEDRCMLSWVSINQLKINKKLKEKLGNTLCTGRMEIFETYERMVELYTKSNIS